MNPLPSWITVLPLLGIAFAQEPPAAPAEEKAGPQQQEEAAWNVVEIDGKDYLSAESIRKFYKFDTLTKQDDKVLLENKKVRAELSIGSDFAILNGIKFKLSDKVLQQGEEAMVSRMDLSKLLDPVLRPNYIEGGFKFSTIVIDPLPAPEGADPESAEAKAAGFAFEMAEKLKTQLTKPDFKVELTRESGETPSLDQRAERIGMADVTAVVISLGFTTDGSERGIRTRVMAPRGVPGIEGMLKEDDTAERPGNANENLGMALATSVHGQVFQRLGKANNIDLGIVRSRYPLLERTQQPMIFMECGSMTHDYEKRVVATEAYRDAIVKAISHAIDRYRKAVTKE